MPPVIGGRIINNQPPQVVRNLFTNDHSLLPYQNWNLAIRYRLVNGTVAMPVAEKLSGSGLGSNRCEVVRRHAPISKMFVQFATTRKGDWPLLPDPKPRDPNLVLDTVDWWVVTPKLQAEGLHHVFGLAGVYAYHCIVPIDGTAVGLFAGVSPVDRTPWFWMSQKQFKPLV